MDPSYILNYLNDKQKEAVIAPNGNILVLAGAGSGKTRVLVHRIAWLLLTKRCSPNSVIAVTFTNKAASEIRNRIKNLIGDYNQNNMWIGTFHSLANRLLRIHYQDANLPKGFQIIDNDDQLRFLKNLIRNMNLDEKKWSPKQAMWYILKKKDEGLRPTKLNFAKNIMEYTWQKIYQNYQEHCYRSGLVDFSELLLKSYELWIYKPNILKYYQNLFTNILVDEFQDTNFIQYSWIRALAGKHSNVMVVGDDDQSIYSWRGAKIENIQHFLHDFDNAKKIFLEQNYRSTSKIINAANAIISNNNKRLEKNLWTKDISGEPISVYSAFNDFDEAKFIINCIKINKKIGIKFMDCAILYRSNSQSRVLEEALIQSGIPYRVYGSAKFFDRQEIKDAISYLRLISNRSDDAAYERIINIPKRGLGNKTINLLRKFSCNKNLTLWESSKILILKKILSNRSSFALQNFLELIDFLDKKTKNLPLHTQVDLVIKYSGLLNMYEKEKGEKGRSRVENLKELVNSTLQLNLNNNFKEESFLQSFLSYIYLESKEGKQLDEHQDKVQLMTLHSSKGLEFIQVFIVGMEEGMFPSKWSLDKEDCLEEERRLAYVGVTRAMKKLTITYAKSRRLYGKEIFHEPSRFINEIPISCLKKINIYINLNNFF